MTPSYYKEDTKTTSDRTSGNIEKKIKIRTHFGKIIVNPSGRPYYSILYFDPADKTYHIGFSSYKLSFVREWLKDEFEVYDGPAGDVDPAVYGYWVDECNKKVCVCSFCNESFDNTNQFTERWSYCPNCGAKMDLLHEKEKET